MKCRAQRYIELEILLLRKQGVGPDNTPDDSMTTGNPVITRSRISQSDPVSCVNGDADGADGADDCVDWEIIDCVDVVNGSSPKRRKTGFLVNRVYISLTLALALTLALTLIEGSSYESSLHIHTTKDAVGLVRARFRVTVRVTVRVREATWSYAVGLVNAVWLVNAKQLRPDVMT